MPELGRVWNRAIGKLRPASDTNAVEYRPTLAHPIVKGMPRVHLASQAAMDRPERLANARRLLDAYKVSAAQEPTAPLKAPSDDLWTGLVENEFGDLLQILAEDDAQALSEYLLHYGEDYKWFGGLTLAVDGYNPQADSSEVALSYLDKLVCLAEALGVLSLENPEQSAEWGANLYSDIDTVVAGIEDAIGISIVPPAGVTPVTGISTSRGLIHYRHLNGLYAALRVKDLVPADSRICEYGGGIGLVAYYASALGFADYTIFDLPLVNIFAGHFLLGALGADKVWLNGESAGAGVHVLPYWQCADAPSAGYRLSLNQDSFPEIDSSLVSEYLRQIERSTTEFFLSINQEAQASMGTRKQNSVPALVSGFGNFHRIYRMKYWMREGYVEELYELRRR